MSKKWIRELKKYYKPPIRISRPNKMKRCIEMPRKRMPYNVFNTKSASKLKRWRPWERRCASRGSRKHRSRSRFKIKKLRNMCLSKSRWKCQKKESKVNLRRQRSIFISNNKRRNNLKKRNQLIIVKYSSLLWQISPASQSKPFSKILCCIKKFPLTFQKSPSSGNPISLNLFRFSQNRITKCPKTQFH